MKTTGALVIIALLAAFPATTTAENLTFDRSQVQLAQSGATYAGFEQIPAAEGLDLAIGEFLLPLNDTDELASITISSTGPTGSSALRGDWTGRLHQKGLDPFTVTAKIDAPAGSSGNTVHYTGINCSGNWRYLGSNGSEHRYREVINRGHGGKCKSVGVVTLTTGSSTDRLGYEFRGGGVVSRGTLRRTG